MPATETEFRLRVLRTGALLTLALAFAGLAYAATTWPEPHRVWLLIGGLGALADGLLMLRFPPRRLIAAGHATLVMALWNVSHAAMIGVLAGVDGGPESPLILVFFTGVVFAALDQPRNVVLAIAGIDIAVLLGLSEVADDWDGRTLFIGVGLVTVAVLASSIARDRADRTGALDLAQREMVHRLARVVEHRDSDTGEHVGRMSGYCALVAQHLGWSHHACEALRLASTMHDIGKVGVPDAILLKRGPLDPGERAIMETHAQVGHDMLADSRSPVVQLAARIALSHHERFDGTGYPQRIAGDAIPLEGRIVAVADVFDALTSDRVYRPAMATDEALAIVEAGRGTHFDPQVVDAFFAALPSILALLDESAEATAAAPVVRVGDAPLAVA